MTVLEAVRVEVDGLDDVDRASLQHAAARDGVLHATTELVVAGFGSAVAIGLPRGLGDPDAPSLVADSLSSVTLRGAPGPGGSGVVALGALPFDAHASGGLTVPELLCAWQPGGATTWLTRVGAGESGDLLAAARSIISETKPLAARNRVVASTERPSGEAFAAAVARCVARLRAGEVRKVVLARSVTGTCEQPIDAAVLAATLHRFDPTCDLYAFAAPEGRFVGASPELIVATADGAVTAHPLAGTVRFDGSRSDDEQSEWLLASSKNLAEHAVVVEDVVTRLGPLCDAIHADAAPSIVRLSTDARLGTWIDAKLRGPRDAATAFATLAALHPTPAVGGAPREAALATIAELEVAPRGQWAGAVGWVDADGTSTWTLGLRAVRADGDRFEVWGGAGIVADSDPDDERDETGGKLASVLRALDA